MTSWVIASYRRAQWHDYLADATLADAICDRILHNAHCIVLKGPSRRKEAKLDELTTASPPCGFTPAGLPAGLQIVGRPFDEAMLFRIGHAYERVTAWHRQRPSLAVAHAH